MTVRGRYITMRGGNVIGTPPPPILIDPDAQTFLTAAGIVDATITSAIDTLVVQLKADGLWTKMKALYPFVGGTATTHKYNLKNPLDTDAAFRLVFSGGVTHNSNGITGNGVNGFANTFLNDSTMLNINDKHIAMYQRNILGAPSQVSMSAGLNVARFYLNFGGSNFSTLGMSQAAFAIVAPQHGMFTMSKTIINSRNYFQNAIAPTTRTGTNFAVNRNYLLLADSRVTVAEFSIANLSLVSIGEGLTNTEAGNYNTAVQAFQTTLSRQV